MLDKHFTCGTINEYRFLVQRRSCVRTFQRAGVLVTHYLHSLLVQNNAGFESSSEAPRWAVSVSFWTLTVKKSNVFDRY